MRSQTCHKKPMTIVSIIKTPVRVVSKALDLYVKGVNTFSTTYNRPFAVMDTPTDCQRLPRSFSTSRLSDNDQPPAGALVRSISTTNTGNTTRQIDVAELELELELYRAQHRQRQLRSYASRKGVPRGRSVRMGKIDEDRVSSFRDDDFILESKRDIKDTNLVFSKSRSYNPVSSKTSKFM